MKRKHTPEPSPAQQYAIYMRDEYGDWVLLKDAAWIAPQSAEQTERHGDHTHVLYEIEKFSTRRKAFQFRRTHRVDGRSYVDVWPKPQQGDRT